MKTTMSRDNKTMRNIIITAACLNILGMSTLSMDSNQNTKRPLEHECNDEGSKNIEKKYKVDSPPVLSKAPLSDFQQIKEEIELFKKSEKKSPEEIKKFLIYFFQANMHREILESKKNDLMEAISTAEDEENEENIFLTEQSFLSPSLIELQNKINDLLKEIKEMSREMGTLIFWCFSFIKPTIPIVTPTYIDPTPPLEGLHIEKISGSHIDFGPLFYSIPVLFYNDELIQKNILFRENNSAQKKVGFFYIEQKKHVTYIAYKTNLGKNKTIRIGLNKEVKVEKKTIAQVQLIPVLKQNISLANNILEKHLSQYNSITTLILENVYFNEKIDNNKIGKGIATERIKTKRQLLLLLLEHMVLNKKLQHFTFTHDKKVKLNDRVEENILIIHRLLQYKALYEQKNWLKNFIGSISPLFYRGALSFNLSEELLDYEDVSQNILSKRTDFKNDFNPFSVSLEDCFFQDIDTLLTDPKSLLQRDYQSETLLIILNFAITKRAEKCDFFKFFSIIEKESIEKLARKNIQSAKKLTFELALKTFFEIIEHVNKIGIEKKAWLSYQPQENELIDDFKKAFFSYRWNINFIL